jgi:arylsulfatase
VSHVVTDACPTVARGWTSEVRLTHPAGDGDGALIARGSLNSGFVLFIKNGRLVFDYNDFHRHTRLEAAEPLAPGDHTIVLEVVREGDGTGKASLSVDGRSVAAGAIPRLLFIISSTGMDVGRSLSPVTDDYAAPFAYPGRIERIVFQLPDGSAPRGEVRANMRAESVRQ